MQHVIPTTARPTATYILSRWLFLRLLGGVYLVAFLSLWAQIHGLVGSQGILPAAGYLERAREHLGDQAYWQLPTLCWLNASDASLTALCAAGTIAALLLLTGIAPLPALLVLWASYLSLTVAGQVFFSFQWDTLLLETGFLAMFLAPLSLWPRLALEKPPSAAGRWLLWLLLFKLMFLSGATKLLSGDPTWRDLTALNYHYETQPIPTWVGWYAHQLPTWWQKTSVIGMFVAELALPFCIFAPRLIRHAGCLLMIVFQLAIAVTGNYCFFNMLAIGLCLLLLDDRLLMRFFPTRWLPKSLSPARRSGEEAQPLVLEAGRETLPAPAFAKAHPLASLFGWQEGGSFDTASPRRPWWVRATLLAATATLLLISGLTLVREMVRTHDADKLPRGISVVLSGCDRYLLSWAEPHVLRWTNPFRTINGYGLFRVMTTERPEIIIEGSADGRNWQAYGFTFKPGDLRRRPPFVAPHQPRLDWQMWFAALNPRGNQHWLGALMQRLLEGSPDVVGLLETNPFSAAPPRYVRLIGFDYEFTDVETQRATGRWWQRTRRGPLTPALSLEKE